MPRIGLQIRIPGLKIDKRQLSRVASRALEKKGIKLGVNITLIDEAGIRELNRNFLGRDRVTDVLAFPLCSDDFALPSRSHALLGEIVICYPQAVRQAVEYGQPVDRELALLVIHGILHLLGYRDETPEATEEMRAEEQRLLLETAP